MSARPFETISEAATRLGCTQDTVRRYCRLARWPGAQQFGRAYLVPAGSPLPSRGKPGPKPRTPATHKYNRVRP